jgi:hypothetical protein
VGVPNQAHGIEHGHQDQSGEQDGTNNPSIPKEHGEGRRRDRERREALRNNANRDNALGP